jgi:glycosyltransferase involved in cell wall biosynthesis
MLLVRNGVDQTQFRSTPVSANGASLILGVGSLLPVKRWDRLIRVAKELKTDHNKFLVEIVGDGPLREPLQHLAWDLGVADRVKLVGFAADVQLRMKDATFLVHTSDVEGCPNAIMEAMMCGRAVVAMDAGDIPYLIEDGRTGFIVRSGDDAGLLERVMALTADRSLCQRMGQAAREKAEREFGLEKLVSNTLAAYKIAGWKDA